MKACHYGIYSPFYFKILFYFVSYPQPKKYKNRIPIRFHSLKRFFDHKFKKLSTSSNLNDTNVFMQFYKSYPQATNRMVEPFRVLSVSVSILTINIHTNSMIPRVTAILCEIIKY